MKKPKYPFSQMRLEKQRAEIEQSRLKLAAETEESEKVRESWEPAERDYSAAAIAEGEKAEAERMRLAELEANYDDNVTNKVLSISESPFEPAPPREPIGAKHAPGLDCRLSEKKLQPLPRLLLPLIFEY